MFRRLLTVSLFLLLYAGLQAQQSPAVVDSAMARLSRATTSSAKIEALGFLSRVLMNTDIARADSFATLMNQEAAISRDRRLMVKALLVNGERYGYFITRKDFIDKSLDYYSRALEVARENRLEKETVEAYLGLAGAHAASAALDKALNFTNQAFAIAANVKDDSLQVAVHNSYGNIYQLRKENILALRHYLNGLRIAEEAGNHTLMRSAYRNLGSFYAGIKDYDKAIDYAQKAMDELKRIQAPNSKYNFIVDHYTIGNLYLLKKDFELAAYYYERSIFLADSSRYPPLKVPGINGLLNMYIEAKQPQKALQFFNARPELKAFIHNAGLGHEIDNAYAVIYRDLGRYDSAKYYFEKSAAGFEQRGTHLNKMGYYMHYAEFFQRSGNLPQAIAHYEKALALADATGNLEWQQNITKEMDSAYARMGDYANSYRYSNLYHKYHDSLQQLAEEKDLLQMELADEQQRQERLAREKALALQRKHNVQYMGITIAIAVVFVMLVLLGIFQVSESTIRIMGFFAFILLFEFIILIADSRIHHWTHGEPLPILGIKIVLIAVLLPLHHWLEHRVVSYLSSRKLIISRGRFAWSNIVARRRPKGSDLLQ